MSSSPQGSVHELHKLYAFVRDVVEFTCIALGHGGRMRQRSPTDRTAETIHVVLPVGKGVNEPVPTCEVSRWSIQLFSSKEVLSDVGVSTETSRIIAVLYDIVRHCDDLVKVCKTPLDFKSYVVSHQLSVDAPPVGEEETIYPFTALQFKVTDAHFDALIDNLPDPLNTKEHQEFRKECLLHILKMSAPDLDHHLTYIINIVTGALHHVGTAIALQKLWDRKSHRFGKIYVPQVAELRSQHGSLVDCLRAAVVDSGLGLQVKPQAEPNGPEDAAKKKEFHIIVEHILQQCKLHRLRKKDGLCWEQCLTTERYNTHAWKTTTKFSHCQDAIHPAHINRMVQYFTASDKFPEIWQKLMGIQAPMQRLTNYFCECDTAAFPYLRPQRHLLSFQNGVYDMGCPSLAREHADAVPAAGTFYTYGEQATRYLRDENSDFLVSAKYHDSELPVKLYEQLRRDPDSWFTEAKTPIFQSILDYQERGTPKTREKSEAPDEPPQEIRPELDGNLCYRVYGKLFDEVQEIIPKLIVEKMREDLDIADEEVPERFAALGESLKSLLEERLQVLTNDIRTELATELMSNEAVPEDTGRGPQGLHVVEAANEAPGLPKSSRFPAEAQKWVYIFLGRMFHELNVWDRWQIIPFFKGRAGTGKSSIAQLIGDVFQKEDIGTLGNNCEKTFGLQSLLGKFCWYCLELKKNFQLDQAQFQSMVSGEDVSIAIKNHAAQTMQWRAPGLLCGNESPGWLDAGGSIARRLAIFNFKFGVRAEHSRTNMTENIRSQELATLILKANCAYLWKCKKSRGQDIWKLLPQYFQKQRIELQIDTDPVYAAIYDTTYFLLYKDNEEEANSSREEWYLPFSEVEQHYHQKWKEIRGTHPLPLNQDRYTAAFDHAALSYVYERRKDPQTQDERMDAWILGIKRAQQH